MADEKAETSETDENDTSVLLSALADARELCYENAWVDASNYFREKIITFMRMMRVKSCCMIEIETHVVTNVCILFVVI